MSYRRGDSADVAGRIYDRLKDHFGAEVVFKDVDKIPFGVDFRRHLDGKVSECSAFLVIIGRAWLESSNEEGKSRLTDPADFVRVEVESALKRDIPVIPLLVHGTQMPATEDLPESLRDLSFRNAVPVRPDPDFHNDMDRLIHGLESHLGIAKAQSAKDSDVNQQPSTQETVAVTEPGIRAGSDLEPGSASGSSVSTDAAQVEPMRRQTRKFGFALAGLLIMSAAAYLVVDRLPSRDGADEQSEQARRELAAQEQQRHEREAQQAAELERRQAEALQAEVDRKRREALEETRLLAAQRQQLETERARLEQLRADQQAAEQRQQQATASEAAIAARVAAQAEAAARAAGKVAAEGSQAPISESNGATEQSKRIDSLIALGRKAVQASRLTTPEGNNALAHYLEVLALDSENERAIAGLTSIVSRYLSLTDKAIGDADFRQAHELINRARRVDPTDARIEPAAARILRLREQHAEQVRVQQQLANERKSQDLETQQAAALKAQDARKRRELEQAKTIEAPKESDQPALQRRVRLALFPHEEMRECFHSVSGRMVDAASAVAASRSNVELAYSWYAAGAAPAGLGSGSLIWAGNAVAKRPAVSQVQAVSSTLGANAVLMGWYDCSPSPNVDDFSYAVEVFLVDVLSGKVYSERAALYDSASVVRKLIGKLAADRG